MKKINMSFVIIISFMFSMCPHKNSKAAETSREYKERINTVCRSIDYSIRQHIDSLVDFQDGCQDSLYTSNNTKIQFIPAVRENVCHLTNRRITIRNIIQSIHSDDEENTLFKAIYEFMNERLFILNARREKLEEAIKLRANGTNVFYAWTTDPSRDKELRGDIEITLVKLTTDMYQTFNKTIISLLSLTNITKLPNKIKKLIKMSPSLWSQIESETDDLGHPDEAIFSDSPDDIRDVHYYRFYKRNELITEIGRNVPATLPTPTFLIPTPPAINLTESSRIDDWLDDFSFHASSGKHSKGNKSKSRKKKSDKKKSKTLSTSQNQKDSDSDSEFENDDGLTTEVAKPDFETSTTVTSAKLNLTLEEKEYILSRHAKQQKEFIQTLKGNSTYDIPLQQPKQQLTGTHLTTYQNIYDTELRNVPYSDFKSLWEYLGGEILNPKSGGSHRTLKFNGHTIGGTFEPHSGHNYGYNCMKYLRDALNKLKSLLPSGSLLESR